MMHLDPELLAGVALESADILDPVERRHLESCPACTAEVESFGAAAHVLQHADRSGGPAPVPALWDRIAAELRVDESFASRSSTPGVSATPGPSATPIATTPSAAPAPVPDDPGVVVPLRGRPRWALALLAAAVGLVVGVGGTVLVGRSLTPTDVVASTALVALPGHSGSGTAELVRHDGVTELRVAVQAAQPEQDYRELWLLNTDGERMYSLGVLPVSGEGTYPVPPQLSDDLSGFTIVDVSLEPYDGQVAHSANSLVRGSLPV